jgi:carbonic anhydrase
MLLDEILLANRLFTSKYGEYFKKISPQPKKQVAIFTCMDTRLVEFLEPAMGIKRGEAKIIKNAGNRIREGCEDVIRSLAATVFLLGAKEIFVIGHLDCGMSKVNPQVLRERMLQYGIFAEEIDKIDMTKWIGSFSDTEENVIDAVNKIKNHPLIPKIVPVHGLLFCPNTGELKVIVKGYN